MSTLREKYITGELFAVGEIVLDKNEKTVHEVVSLGANYLTVVDATGTIGKKWLKDVISAETLREDFEDLRRKRSSKNQIAFLGYKTKNFNEELAPLFKSIIKENRKDKFIVLSLLRVTDELLQESSNITEENYSRVKTLLERNEKYLDKFNQLPYHTYRKDLVEAVTMFELEEGIKVTSIDRSRAARIIGDALGVASEGTPEEIVNAAASKMKSGKYTPEAWKIAGKMFNMATDIGIKWNKDIFVKPTQKAMGIK